MRTQHAFRTELSAPIAWKHAWGKAKPCRLSAVLKAGSKNVIDLSKAAQSALCQDSLH